MSKIAYYLQSIPRILVGMQPLLPVIAAFLGRKNTFTLRLRAGGACLRVRSAMDIWSVKETFLDRFYERHGFRVEPGWNVVDIGAGVGEFALFAALQAPGIKAAAFEPFPNSFQLLRENLALNPGLQVSAYPLAVSGEGGEMVLDFSGREPVQVKSSHGMGSGERVQSLSLSAALDAAGMPVCDLLKLDCEGAEYDILFHAGLPALQRVRRMVMEYHDHTTPHNHVELEDFLQRSGFKVESVPNVVHPEIGYLKAWQIQPLPDKDQD